MTLQRISPADLKRRLDAGEPLLLLDVRRSEALVRNPMGIASAVPILLDEAEPGVPDLPRETEMLAYCLCSGQASSTRVALWLAQAGYRNVWVLDGGLPAWQAADLPTVPISMNARGEVGRWLGVRKLSAAPAQAGTGLIAESAFLAGMNLPVKREMAVLFVDMVNSTELLFAHTPERVLALVQAFMEVVVDVAVQHCGDVHDFEGDGAMLYFAGPGEAVPAAFNLRSALAARRHELADLPQVRLALDSGPLVVGYVGSRERRGLSFIGPSINTAARILKLAPPGGIVATDSIVRHARRTDPDLAMRFREIPERQHLKGFAAPVAIHVAQPEAEHCSHGCEGT